MAETVEVWLRWTTFGECPPHEREQVLVMRTLSSGEVEVFAGWMSRQHDGLPVWHEYFPKHPFSSADDEQGFVAGRGEAKSTDLWKSLSRSPIFVRDSREKQK